MSFDLLPADLILKIFHELPFKDRVRLGGVNHMFRDASEESINKMKSLHLTNDLVIYSIWTQPFSALLESWSPILESIDASSHSCNRWLLKAMAEFSYPRLEHLKILVRQIDPNPPNLPYQIKKLITRCPNLHSIVLHLNCQFEWPENMVYQNLEKLEIHKGWDNNINLSPILNRLIDRVPKLKLLTIKGENVSFSVQEFSQLLASTPSLEQLKLDNISMDIMDVAMSAWRLPKLTTLYFNSNFNWSNPSMIFQHFPSAFPRLESFTSDKIKEIDNEGLLALQQLKHLSELCLTSMDMTQDQIIDLISSIPSIGVLVIKEILDIDSHEKLIDFLTSTAAIFRSDLQIRVSMAVDVGESELEGVLEEIGNNGGPEVTYWLDENYSLHIISIRYRSMIDIDDLNLRLALLHI